VLAFAADVSKSEDVNAMIDFAVKEFGRLDVLVNNAGVMDDMAPIAQVTDEKYDYVMGINVYGPLCAMRKAVQVFLAQGDGGNIINVSSVGAGHQAAGPVYCASKAAVNALSRSTAYMYKADKIRVNVIAPGAISTEIGSAMGRPNMEGYQKVNPVLQLGVKPGEADDIANTALFLASDDSSYISGAIIPVDGGWTSF
jgi:NAD(P)-dependent dehydrogenase (short-subunit alcohol dehydrogenase family)